MQLKWVYKSFNELTAAELYAIVHLRNEVFVVEQNCIYQDADDKDTLGYHLAGWDGDKLAAYCRILPAGTSYNHPSIGRVISAQAYRKGGLGKQLMQRAIIKTIEQYRDPFIIISAQQYLKNFYEGLGFIQISDVYEEDGIPHIKMQYG